MLLDIEISVKASLPSSFILHSAWNADVVVGTPAAMLDQDVTLRIVLVLRLAEQQDKRPWASDDIIGPPISSLGCLLPNSQ